MCISDVSTPKSYFLPSGMRVFNVPVTIQTGKWTEDYNEKWPLAETNEVLLLGRTMIFTMGWLLYYLNDAKK
jgi:hypothetical protein